MLPVVPAQPRAMLLAGKVSGDSFNESHLPWAATLTACGQHSCATASPQRRTPLHRNSQTAAVVG